MHIPHDRHPSVWHFETLFDFEHLTNRELRVVSNACHDLAQDMVDHLADSAELSAGLRKLLEAKDCFVRAKVLEQNARDEDEDQDDDEDDRRGKRKGRKR